MELARRPEIPGRHHWLCGLACRGGWKIARSITKDGERRCGEMKKCVEYKFSSTSRATTVAPGLLRLNQPLAAVSATDAALRAP